MIMFSKLFANECLYGLIQYEMKIADFYVEFIKARYLNNIIRVGLL